MMVNIVALASTSLLAGAFFLIAVVAYDEYKRYRSQQQQTHSNGTSNSNRTSTARSLPQPSNECYICHDSLTAPLEVLPCGHIYHRYCIKKWFEYRINCAICRCSLTEEQAKDYKKRLQL
jgi:E3 ubiquitin-protein ligase synoviolin